MNKEIEKSILYIVHHLHFTAHQLAVCNVFYNAPDSGITLDALANRTGRTVAEIESILGKLTQEIDRMENPAQRFGFNGYQLLFERFSGDWHILRPELRVVVDQHEKLRDVMQIPIEQVYKDYTNGLDAH